MVNTRKRKNIDNIWDLYKFNDDETNALKHKTTNNMLGWVSATQTKNYLLDDQCVDWLSRYYNKNNKSMPDTNHDILFEGGHVFEDKICEELKNIYKDDFVIVFNAIDMAQYNKNKIIDNVFKKGNNMVKSLMKKGVPIIAQAPLINETNKTYGIADILIRSDYISTLVNTFIPDDEINERGPLLNIDKKTQKYYHYRVLDFKWSSLVLCVDGVTIRNQGLFPAYKGQLTVYTACLESLQGYIPNYAYIMAKSWKINTKIPQIGYSAFERLGVIDYKNKDKHVLLDTKNAIKWVQDVMINGHKWKYNKNKPTHDGMYPNMNKTFNPSYTHIKEQIAIKYGDPTLCWYVGSEHRKNAIKHGVYSINDEKCTADSLGIHTNRKYIIDEIININKNNQNEDIIRPLCIKNNMCDWQHETNSDYYVDFETINYNLFVEPHNMNIDMSYCGTDVTFMIGIGFKHNTCDTQNIIKKCNINPKICSYTYVIDKKTGWAYICLYLTKFK